MTAYAGKVLWVDLSLGTWREEVLPDSFYRKYLSGLGLASALLYREIPRGADALGPENVLGFVSGLLTGTGSFFTGRWMAVAKSPLTGTWGDANCGGTLAPAIKQCGYDGIFFKGQSASPVYLYIGPHGPELRDAAALWGRDAIETEDELQRLHAGKKKPAVACIGPAGENLSLISGIVNDRGRLAARSGLGAVMGSKKLKAVVLAGSRRISAARPLQMHRLSWSCRRKAILPIQFPNSKAFVLIGKLVSKLPFGFTFDGLLLEGILAKWGTPGLTPYGVETGDTPFRNWAGSWKEYPTINQVTNGERLLSHEQHKYHCYSCPLGCGGIVSLGVQLPESHKPEYETIAAFTALIMSRNMEAVYLANEYLNRAGMDTISAGNTVAFAMECYEKGWITPADTGGMELTWGNDAILLPLLEQMVKREGIGALLADGTRAAARKLNAQSMTAAVQAGGQEIGFHDPRLDPGMGLHASVEPTPGRHTTGSQQYYEMYHLWKRVTAAPQPAFFYSKASKKDTQGERITAAVANSEFQQVYNGAGGCMFGMLIGVDRVPIFEWLNAATGWDYSPDDYMRIGRRIQTLRQAFNVREGISPMDLKVNKRLYDFPLPEGPNKGVTFDLEAMMHAYWQEIGWDRDSGAPTPQSLAELDLTDWVEA